MNDDPTIDWITGASTDPPIRRRIDV